MTNFIVGRIQMTGSNYHCTTLCIQVQNDQMLLCKIFAHLVRRNGIENIVETSECISSETMYERMGSCKFDIPTIVDSRVNLTMMINSIVHKLILFKLDNESVSFEILELEELSNGFDRKDFESFCQKKARVCQSFGLGQVLFCPGRVCDGLIFSCYQGIDSLTPICGYVCKYLLLEFSPILGPFGLFLPYFIAILCSFSSF